jgi:hypothetical protein
MKDNRTRHSRLLQRQLRRLRAMNCRGFGGGNNVVVVAWWRVKEWEVRMAS